jgi:hypothetical protein
LYTVFLFIYLLFNPLKGWLGDVQECLGSAGPTLSGSVVSKVQELPPQYEDHMSVLNRGIDWDGGRPDETDIASKEASSEV